MVVGLLFLALGLWYCEAVYDPGRPGPGAIQGMREVGTRIPNRRPGRELGAVGLRDGRLRPAAVG